MKTDVLSPLSRLLDPDLMLSVAALPVLVGLVSARAAAKTMQDLGTLSEEIFRGDRLPILEFPDAEEN
jgi:hypothetical protein